MNRSRRSLALTTSLHCLNHAMHSMLPPLYLAIRHDFHKQNLAPIYLGATLYLVFYSIFQLPLGILSDRFSRKWLLGACALLNSLLFIGVGLSWSYPLWLAMMSLSGLFGAAYHPIGTAFLADLFQDRKGAAIGVSGIGATAGLSLSPMFSGVMSDAMGWRATVVIFGAVGVATALLFLLLSEDTKRSSQSSAPRISMKENGLLLFICLIGMVFALREFCGWGGYSLITVFCQIIYHYSASQGGVVNGVQSAAGFVMQPLGGFLSDRFGRKRLLVILILATAASMTLLPWVGKAFIIPFTFFYGMMYTGTVPIIDAMIGDRTPSSIRGMVYGIYTTVGIGIGSLSPILLGLVLDNYRQSLMGFHAAFGILGGSCLLSALLLMAVKTGERSKSERGATI